ncbi:hypothetical protein ACFOU2_09805 [Bacillus songklensis]|uniref:Replicative helicase inhibitor G39P N-terminal domain-containing protein n=1 Tax=Bacillus songklensis TaxID=1069116 RepID=A0ABV8B2L7_9BACI
MTSKQVLSILRYIAEAYPNFEITQQRVAIWIEQLSPVEYEPALAKVKKHVSQCKFAPTIAEVYVEPEKSRINYKHLEKMRRLRGDEYYATNFGNEVQH